MVWEGRVERDLPFPIGRHYTLTAHAMSKKLQMPGICVFCGMTGVTKQHMWPDWLKTILPRSGESHTQFITRFDLRTAGVAIVRPELHFPRGPVGARKIRRVCATCNSGWISRLENDAKPYLSALILNQSIEIDGPAQAAIAAWAALFSIVAEYTDILTMGISHADRYDLMKTGLPPTTWRIGIARYHGSEWRQRYRHHGLQGISTKGAVPPNSQFNTQISTFVIGALLLHTASSSLSSVTLEFDRINDVGLVNIWPPRTDAFTWQSRQLISDTDCNRIADYFLLTHGIRK